MSSSALPAPAPRGRPPTAGPRDSILHATEMLLGIALALLLSTVALADPPAQKTLAECITLALEQQPTLKAAGASIEAGRERVWQAAAAYLPQVTANYSTVRRKANAGSLTGSNAVGRSATFNFYSIGVGLSQVLFDFGQNLALIHELAEARFDVGLAPRIDVTTAQVQLASAELTQVTAHNNVSLARETLRNAIGLMGPLDFEIVDALEQAPLQVHDEEVLALAYDNRPELRSLRAQEEAQSQRIGVGTILELTDAQTSLASAGASRVQALVNRRTAVASLERSTSHELITD